MFYSSPPTWRACRGGTTPRRGSCGLDICDGAVMLVQTTDGKPLPASVGLARMPAPTHLWVPMYIRGSTKYPARALVIPFSSLAALVLFSTVWFFRLDRRPLPPGHCAKCGYDLSATPAASGCPECGAGSGEARPRSG